MTFPYKNAIYILSPPLPPLAPTPPSFPPLVLFLFQNGLPSAFMIYYFFQICLSFVRAIVPYWSLCVACFT